MTPDASARHRERAREWIASITCAPDDAAGYDALVHFAAIIEAEAREGMAAQGAVPAGAALFRSGDFALHSGARSAFKIDCDALIDADWTTLAGMIARAKAPFSRVVGVPRGGLKLATALESYCGALGPVLVVDDVLTTGASITATKDELAAQGNTVFGAVVFARGPIPAWVTPLFVMSAGTEVASTDAADMKLALAIYERALAAQQPTPSVSPEPS